MLRVFGIVLVQAVLHFLTLRRRFAKRTDGATPQWRAAALLAVALALPGAPVHAKQTIAQQPTAWSYGLCDEFPPFPQRGVLACTIWAEGQFLGSQSGCANAKPLTEPSLVPKAVAFETAIWRACSITHSWSGWMAPGQVISSGECWSGGPVFRNGVEVSNLAAIPTSGIGRDAQTQQCTRAFSERVIARRDRQLNCSNAPGYAPSSAGCTLTNKRLAEANLGVCTRDNPATANPITPATGNKYLVEADYRGSGPMPLQFVRTYNRMGPANAVLGAKWRHTYERWIVLSVTGTLTTAKVHRPDGKAFYFNLENGAWVADNDLTDRLEWVTDANGRPASWTYLTAADEREGYNAEGRLVSITSRAGLQTNLEYDSERALLSRVTDPFGRQLAFAYDTRGKLTVLTDPAGGQYQFRYDEAPHPAGANNLTSVVYPDAAVRRYHYENPAFPGALTGVTDENGERFATYAYDVQGRAVLSEHAGGAERHELTYHADGSVLVTDPLGTARTYHYGAPFTQFKLTAVDGPACATCGGPARSYDANGFVASRTDWNGNVTTLVHDARGLESSRTEAVGTPQARTVTTTWHPVLRLPLQIVEPGRSTEFTYDDQGNELTRTVTDTASGRSRTWSSAYIFSASVPGLIEQKTVDGPRTDVADLTTFTYYPNEDPDPGRRGQLASVTNALGQLTRIDAYNLHGQPTALTDPNGLVTTLGYDARLRLVSRDVGGEVTTYTYDAAGQLTGVSLPDGSALSYTYDAAHRLIAVADSLGQRIAYTLDPMGNRIREDVFDPQGSLAQTRSRVFDGLNRLAQDIGGTDPAAQVTRYAYDPQGNLTAITDPLNRVTTQGYDTLNRLISVTDPANGLTRFGYTALDQLASIADPRSLVTTYTANALDELERQISPDTGASVNTFDAAGNRLTATDARGITARSSYDALNRVTQIVYPDQTLTFSYDQGANGVGRLTGFSDASGSTAFAYDPHGRVTAETRTLAGVSHVTRYQYDGAGRLVGLTYPSGRTLSYTRDALGRIAQIDTAAAGVTEPVVLGVTYRPFGPVQGFLFGNATAYSRSFDRDGRISAHTLDSHTRTLTWDAASRVTQIADAADPAAAIAYGYDALDRLTQAATASTGYAYTSDAAGNRLSRSAGGALTTYSISPGSNGLAAITPPSGGPRSVSRDGAGATIDDGVRQYSYDGRGRLTAAVSALGSTSYQVNALGQRVVKTLPGAGAGQTLLADGFAGPEGRPIDDQADGLWRGGGKKQPVARVRDGQAEIAPRRQMHTASAFALPEAGLVLQATLTRGTVALTRAGSDAAGVRVEYAGADQVLIHAPAAPAPDEHARPKRRYRLAAPGAVLKVVIELTPGAARVRISAGADTLDSGELALPTARPGTRYRIGLGAVRGSPQSRTHPRALTGRIDEVVLTAGGGAPVVTATHYLYDGPGHLIGEYDGTGAPLREYAYLGELPLALIEPDGALSFIHTDHLATPRVVVNAQNQPRWRWDSAEPFGDTPPQGNPANLGAFEFNLRFPGQYFDKETNLHYNGFRDYDPSIGRYIQSDSIGLVGGINTYAYVSSNPLARIEPTGEADVRIENAMRAAGLPPPVPPRGVLDEECFLKCVVIGKAAASIGTTVAIDKAANAARGPITSAAAQGVRAIANNPFVIGVGALFGLDYCYQNCRKDPATCEPTPLFQSTAFFQGAP